MSWTKQVSGSVFAALLGLASSAAADGTALVRYTATGAYDNSFDGDGRVVHESSGDPDSVAIAISPFGDGKIVTVGAFTSGTERKVVIARHNPDGSLDNFFGYGGVATFDAVPGQSERLVAVTFDTSRRILVAGSVIVGGTQSPLVARLLDNGTVDNKFGVGGFYLAPGLATNTWDSVTDMKRDAAGYLYVAGSTSNKAVVFRLTAAGVLDSNWATAGCAVVDLDDVLDEARALAFDGDKIVVAGNSAAALQGAPVTGFAYRLLSNGSLDPSFNGGHPQVVLSDDLGPSAAIGVAVDSQHRPVVSGYNFLNGFALERLTSVGFSDSNFGGGVVFPALPATTVDGAARERIGSGDSVYATGNATIGGITRFATVHYLSNGQPDNKFGAGGYVITTFTGVNASGTALAVDSNGAIVVTGTLETP